jgi:hypothetical protein
MDLKSFSDHQVFSLPEDQAKIIYSIKALVGNRLVEKRA